VSGNPENIPKQRLISIPERKHPIQTFLYGLKLPKIRRIPMFGLAPAQADLQGDALSMPGKTVHTVKARPHGRGFALQRPLRRATAPCRPYLPNATSGGEDRCCTRASHPHAANTSSTPRTL
jgi:hypothetical protein